ncbi:uncharacterized protein K02A2.6-like [Malaya genurostris]|uniref:uncharacterized protein K02A2.6-like n=1 Tax=Malaya genurostris TaxID=325434 RepID=UPI0026F3884B|nr:uncharacterized protein K02A2.6-like [Malaya genurostris]
MGAPYHPATNGQVERFIQTFKNKMKALQCDKSRMHVELCNILLSYRKTIHPTTDKSPSMMLFNRQIRSRIDLLLPGATYLERDDPKVQSISVGERVAARDFLDHEKWKYGRVIEKLGKLHYTIQLDDNRIWKRHIDQLREVGQNLKSNGSLPEMPKQQHKFGGTTTPETSQPISEHDFTSGSVQKPLRRSTREVKAPERLNL